MVRIDKILELLRNLIMSTPKSTVKFNKDTLRDIQISLQNAHEKIFIFSLNLSYNKKNYISVVIILNLFLFKKLKQTPKQQVNNVAVDSHSVPSSKADLYADADVHTSPPKPIIRPWEELVHNKHKTGLGYDKELSFHILDYSNPIKFQSAGFLHDSSPTTVLDSAPLPKHKQQIEKF